MQDNLKQLWDKYWSQRTVDLFNKYNGLLRAQVVDTNDPLNMHRVRFKCPELHDSDVPKEALPWAVPASSFGGSGSGTWSHPCIGDNIWIGFEKGHPAGPIWIGAADATRKGLYPQQSIYTKTPKSINQEGKFEQRDDFIEDYLPKDGRPMSIGTKDRYGNFTIMSSVGFFPIEHKVDPVPVGTDNLSGSKFSTKSANPEINKPDVKLMAQVTKYGTVVVMSDVGYKWDNEFDGDFNKDKDFETKRTKYLLKQLTEDSFESRDQRRYEVKTRYGHKFEMRDVGWDKSRATEYDDDQQIIGDSNDRDERWIKLRTKGGHFIEFIDIGFDSEQDEYIKKLNKTEIGASTEEEDKLGKDARMIRFQTRYGFQQVMDDRGSDTKDATNREEPRGAGWFVKGRRGGRGSFIGFNEKDDFQNFQIITPNSKILEFSDRFGYIAIATDTSKPVSEERKSLYGVTWNTLNALSTDFERDTHHLKLDLVNRYARLKNPTGAGVEFRDPGSANSPCSNWSEMRDSADRGVFFNTERDYAVWRSKDNMIYILLDDAQSLLMINNEKNLIQISAKKNVEILAAEEVVIKANKKISLKADQEITFDVSGTQFSIVPGTVGTNANTFIAKEVLARASSATVAGALGGTAPGPGFGVAASDSSKPDLNKPAKPDGKEGERLLGKPDNTDCKEEQDKLQKEADELKKKMDDSKKLADEAFEKAKDTLQKARDAVKEMKASSGAKKQEARQNARNIIKDYKKDRQANKDSNKQFQDDAKAYKKAQKKADTACQQTDNGVDRGCAPNKKEAGPVPLENAGGGGGGGSGGGGNGIPITPPAEPEEKPESPDVPIEFSATPPTPPVVEPDPIANVGGVGDSLWYGTTNKFINDILANGLQIKSFANLVQLPSIPLLEFVQLPLNLKTAGEFALETQKRYGGDKLIILRIRSIGIPDLLFEDTDNTAVYFGDIIEPKFIEVVETISKKPLTSPIYKI